MWNDMNSINLIYLGVFGVQSSLSHSLSLFRSASTTSSDQNLFYYQSGKEKDTFRRSVNMSIMVIAQLNEQQTTIYRE